MNKVISPLKMRMKGPAVADLQDALQLCLERNVILADQPQARQQLWAAFRPERDNESFGPTTRKLVRIFQQERGLLGPRGKSSGEVDERTANALNLQVDRLTCPEAEDAEFSINGTVRFSDDSAAGGMTVSAFDRDLRTEQQLGKSETDRQGRYKISYSSGQFLKAEKGSADLVAKVVGSDGTLLASSPVIFNAPPSVEVNITIPAEIRQPLSGARQSGRSGCGLQRWRPREEALPAAAGDV